MPRLGRVGNGIVKRSRGKSTFILKRGGTQVIGSRGNRVSVEDENRVITTTRSHPEKRKTKSVIKRRGRTVSVLKRVRNQ